MSQAPVRRKSRKAVMAAKANAASRKPAPAPHLVVLRVKRKRGDAAVDSLLVATVEGESREEQDMPDRKRRVAGADSIAEIMAVLSLSKTAEQHSQPHQLQQQRHTRMQPPKRLMYKRVRTTEPDSSSDGKRGGRIPTVGSPHIPPKRALDGGGRNGGGGRLDALLSSKGLTSPTSRSPPPAAVLDYMEVRRVKARAVDNGYPTSSVDSSERGGCEQHSSLSGAVASATPPGATGATTPANLHVIDLQAVGRTDTPTMMDTSGTVDGRGGGAIENAPAAAKRIAAPVLTPVERQMDEAIFTAFQTGDMSNLHGILTTSSSPSPASVNYRRRLGNGSTALMAAGFHGDLDTVRHLLSLGAKASLVDAGGKSAALFAGMRGHRECFAELQRAADEEEKEERARSSKRRGSERGCADGSGGRGDDVGGGDFVYDVYYFEPSAPSPTVGAPSAGAREGWMSSTITCEKTMDVAGDAPPVILLSGIGPVDENAVGTMADVELEFEHDSDWSGLGDDDDGEDPDSNSEGYYGNDYPEDEGDDDDAGISPYVYAGGSGSSCASDNDGSSSDGGAGFDNDSDNEPYYRRVVDMREEHSGGFGVAGSVSGGLAGLGDNDGSVDVDVSGFSGGESGSGKSGVSVVGLVERMPPASEVGHRGRGEVKSTYDAGLGEAGVFAWSPKR